jgi:hypothetical protein
LPFYRTIRCSYYWTGCSIFKRNNNHWTLNDIRSCLLHVTKRCLNYIWTITELSPKIQWTVIERLWNWICLPSLRPEYHWHLSELFSSVLMEKCIPRV